MTKSPKTVFEPELNITVTPRGVTRIGIPYSNLAEEKAGRSLQERCAVVISLLGEIARGNCAAQAVEPLVPEPRIDQII